MVDRKSQASGLGVGGGHTSCRGQETCQQPKVPSIIKVALILVPSPWESGAPFTGTATSSQRRPA